MPAGSSKHVFTELACTGWGIPSSANMQTAHFTGTPAAQQANMALTLVLLLLLPVAEDTDAAAGVGPADAPWLLAAE